MSTIKDVRSSICGERLGRLADGLGHLRLLRGGHDDADGAIKVRAGSQILSLLDLLPDG